MINYKMRKSTVNKIKCHFGDADDVLIVGKGPSAEEYLKFIYKETISIGINELTLLPGVRCGFMVDYEPLEYIVKFATEESKSKTLIIAEYPFKKINKAKSRPIDKNITESELFAKLVGIYLNVWAFENRYRKARDDYVPNLVSITALLKILKYSGVSSVRTIGVGSSVGYTTNANTSFGTQLQVGYGQQIPLIYKLSIMLGIKILRHEGHQMKISIINSKCDEQYMIYSSFIENVLMLKGVTILKEHDLSNCAETIVIDCSKHVPQSKYFYSNFERACATSGDGRARSYEEVMSFFVDKSVVLTPESQYCLSPKKSQIMSYYQAVYRAVKELEKNSLAGFNLFRHHFLKSGSILDRKVKFCKVLRLPMLAKIVVIYLYILILEGCESVLMKARTTRLYWLIKYRRVLND